MLNRGDAVNGLSLCAGVGGMDLGLGIACREYRTVCYVEREAFCAATLVARMEDQALDRAPIWDDLTTFDGRPWRGKVDIVSSGLPCQPYSVAGKRRGHADERALWPQFVRIVSECEPAIVFIENVPAFQKHFEPVWRELRELGFEWSPPLLHTASELGASHIRKRFFALAAHTDAARSRLEGWCLPGRRRSDKRAPGSVCGTAQSHSDTDGRRREIEWGGWVFDEERETLRHDFDGHGDGCRTCGTVWSTESPVLRVGDGPADRMGQLRAIGNVGAPPVVYARAFRILMEEL